ncbi:hypothetical protein QC762_303240 [Podospora pseudocomata]|uniref:Uncharacterized protein n=3 Tax=Podospora TaxID=5144 RepID=A0ABY6S5V1_PODCO|nr:hypothetical protein QC762_303240 [Podospora pseudocomata]VBB76940.1 Putative protein of unknown function [Podospora comata]
MVVGLLVIAGIPTTIGVCEALSAQKKANEAAKEKAKFRMTVTVSLDEDGPVECWCVLKNGMLWIDHPSFPVPGHKFFGYYFPYPSEEQHLGMVSTIADDPPMLNWIYVDKDTNLVRHGGRQATLGHTIGPWFWTSDEKWLTLEGDAARFVAVQMENKKWAIALDRDGCFSEEDVSESEDEGESEDESETEGDKEELWPEGGVLNRHRSRQWVPVLLRRQLQLGMESRYVKGANG